MVFRISVDIIQTEVGKEMIRWRLHEEMGKRRLKITDVARETGLAWDTVFSIYHGRAKGVALTTIDKLCTVLGCQPGDLFEYRKDEE